MDAPHRASSSFADVVRILRRRAPLIVALAVACGGVALYVSLREARRYEAQTQVLLSDQTLPASLVGPPSGTASRDPERWAQTQAEVARSPVVAERAVRAAGEEALSPAALLAQSSVTPATNADILSFDVTDPMPRRAVRLANAYATAFIAYRKQLDTDVVRNALVGVAQRIKNLRAEAEQTKPPNPLILQQLGVLLGKQQDLRNLEALQGGDLFVVTAASGAHQTQPKPARDALAGAVAGAILGIVIAFLLNALDNRVRAPDDIREVLGGEILARVGQPPRKLRGSARLAMFDDEFQAYADGYNKLRANFDFANVVFGARKVLVTSCVEQEGKSTTTANLAVALARSGRKVAVVDLDLRRPAIANFFDISDAPGATDVALGSVALHDALTRPSFADGNGGRADVTSSAAAHGGLWLLPSGTRGPDPVDLLGSAAIAGILDELATIADVVLIDSPPMLSLSDGATLAGKVDGALVIVRSGKVTPSMLRDMRRQLEAASCGVLGVVMAGVDDASEYGYGKYSRYYTRA